MGRPRTYTAKTLRKAVKTYFDSITRVIKLTEKEDTGEKDDHGHVIYRNVPVMNNLGVQATVTEYLVPPTVGGLCRHLGVVASTWSRWSDAEKYPEFEEIIEETMDRMLTWRKEQVVTRKDVKGLIWDMETNYGCGKQSAKEDEEGQQFGVIVLPELVDITPPSDEEIDDG